MGSEKGRKVKRDDLTHTKTDNNNDDAPSTPVESLARRTAYTRAAATTTKARRRAEKNEIPSSSSNIGSSLKPRRVRGGLRDWDSQITLTQIVSQKESPNADTDLLEYGDDEDENIPPKRRTGVEIIDLVNDSGEEDEDELESRTKSRRRSTLKKDRTRLSPNSIPSTTFKSRKSVGFDSSAKKSTGLGKGNKNERPSKKGKDGNRTLTQMDFVRRYIPLPESDDDMKFYNEPLASISNSPVKAPASNTKEMEEHRNEFPTPRKRRKLSSELAVPKDANPPTTLPQTPQKVRKFEIPSSQTPETPRQEVLPAADVHTVPRLPLEAFSTKTSKSSPEKPPKQPSQAQTQQLDSTIPETAENSVSENSNGPSAGSLGQSTASAFDSTLLPGADEIKQPTKLPEVPSSSFSKAVVYDTDDETEYSDFEDDRLLDSPRPENEPTPKVKSSSNVVEENSIPNSDDSNELPPHIPNSGTDLDINYNAFSDTALPSDASLYYRRPAQYTQYPTEPVPMLDSQKMAELFPNEETEDLPLTPKAPAPLDKERTMRLKNEHSDILCPQTQSDEAEKSTQMVPESSPIARKHEKEERGEGMMPPPREPPVVLVESSQPVDRINRQNSSSLDTGPGLPRLLSASDFLTDSVMESVPPPPWVLSQDSVGEPYPEESRKRDT
ncbi:hypothetical protein PISL3812_07856 [Talaromyces islandicus]|uniref:Uncharacterized protein n=1 Tax=Talaromyces islandicus TaxID=28573 RepID=A0A0U1M760_TALIS|nr:hypothetical protein PISL3812_07856 [Talaromyces islandicus]